MYMSTPFYEVYSHNSILVTSPSGLVTDTNGWAPLQDAPDVPSRAVPARPAAHAHWQQKLGQLFASDVAKGEWEKQDRSWPRRALTRARLSAYPAGFQLFEVQRLDGQTVGQWDRYLRSPFDKHIFRSPEEFGPHLAWILTGRPWDVDEGRSACECCYCSGVEQEKISTRYDNLHELFAESARPEKKPGTDTRSNVRHRLLQAAKKNRKFERDTGMLYVTRTRY